MDGLFNAAQASLGVPVDQIKLIFCFLVAFPLGSLYVRVPYTNTSLRHLFSIVTSLFFLLVVFHLNGGVAQLVAESAFTYFVARYVKSRRMPWIVFWVTMSHLMVNHVIRAWANIGYDTIEITGSQMVLTMKLTTFAWNVYDGRQNPADLDAAQLSTRITDAEFPTLLAFFGYVFYFPGILVGPTVEFTFYNQLVTGKLFASAVGGVAAKRRVPEGRKRVAYQKLALGLFFLGGFALKGGNMDYDRVLEPAFRQHGFLYRLGFVQLLGFAQRTKYYGVWLLTEGASILTGLGFNGYTPSGATKWNRTANVDIWNIEFAPNFKVLLDSWNMNTNVWLRNCVYKRVTPKGKKPGFGSTMMTFGTSAMWHGIAVGYYLSFFLGGFIQFAARLARQYLRPFVLVPSPLGASSPPVEPVPTTLSKRLYDIAGIIVSAMLLNYAVAPFQLLDLQRSIRAWVRMDFYGHIIVGGTILFFSFLGGKSVCAKALKKRGIDVHAKKGAKPVNGTANGVNGNGTKSSPNTPGVLGAPGGFPLMVPNVEQGVKEAQAQFADANGKTTKTE